MKIIFASDMSFNYFSEYPGDESARAAMDDVAKFMAQGDFSMVNLENIFGEKENETPIIKAGPNLISSPRFAEYVHAINPTVIGMANNHAKDFGEGPMLATKAMLEKQGYTVIGAGKNREDAYKSTILEKDGIRVAIVAVCENEFGCSSDTESGTAGYNLRCVSHAIRDAKADGCKPIIYFHGGNEQNPFPSPGKTELYRHFIELGAEAVIAMHTHCPQGYEIYEGKPIVYSMGNFFFPSTKPHKKCWYYGYMSELTLTEDSVSLQLHPYTFDFDKLTVLQGEEKAEFMAYLDTLCAPIADRAEIAAWFDSWCLTQSYIHTLEKYKREMFADGMTAVIPSLKNVFCCEAHNELVCNTMQMIYENRVEAARARVAVINRLQNVEMI